MTALAYTIEAIAGASGIVWATALLLDWRYGLALAGAMLLVDGILNLRRAGRRRMNGTEEG